MKQTELERDIDALARPVAEKMGFEIVLVSFQAGILEILVEDPKTGKAGLDDCATLSRAISAVFELDDPIIEPYRLEVGSPGIERPLVKAEDFTRFAGFDAKIELNVAINGQRRFKGTLKGETGGVITLTTDTGDKQLPLHDVVKARLVLTDDLMKASKQGFGR